MALDVTRAQQFYDEEFGIGGNHKEPEEKPLRPTPSWIDYGNRDIDTLQYHVGEGFMEIGGFIMLIGQSYVGKSTLITQISINLAIGRSWVIFQVHRVLRVLIVQAEDPENKLIKMGRIFKRMGLSKEQIALADKNTAVLTIRDLQDASAIAEIERHATVLKSDVLVINPMTSYLGGSVYKDEVINKFLRVQLTPMLDRLKMSAIVVHHPPKPVISDATPKDLTAFELQYGGAGMAALTNAPRGNMFLVHVDGDVFKLSVGKGFEDLGTKEAVVYLRRSRDENGVMLWERCESEKAEEANQNLDQRKSRKTKGGRPNGDAEEKIITALRAAECVAQLPGLKACEIQKATGIPARTFYNAIGNLMPGRVVKCVLNKGYQLSVKERQKVPTGAASDNNE
jgi:AAA domain